MFKCMHLNESRHFFHFVRVFVFCLSWTISPMSPCCALSREITPLRNTWRNSSVLLIRPPSRTSASLRSYTPGLTTIPERSCPGKVLKGASRIMWSGYWSPVDRPWLLELLMMTTAPLLTQLPARHHWAAWSVCLSPTQPKCHHEKKRLSLPSPWTMSRLMHLTRQHQMCQMEFLWNTRGWMKAPQTLPPLRVIVYWTWTLFFNLERHRPCFPYTLPESVNVSDSLVLPSIAFPLPLQIVSPLSLDFATPPLWTCGSPLPSGPPPLRLWPTPRSLSLYDHFLSCQLNFSRSTPPLSI